MNALAYSPWFLLPASLAACAVLLLAIFLLIKNLIKQASYQMIPLVDAVNLQLPQTQCGQCGFSGCRP
ncbi:MAG: hypothetical protein JKY98_03590, partial [Gammaproteobacteria bacterium]|nr:hypothetical protein [Gammaproteobacteria bacterium]